MMRKTTPALEEFTPGERAVIRKCGSPYAVQRWLNSLPYNAEKRGETLRSFRGVVRRGTAHCLEAALSAAAILEQHGYPALFLDLESQDGLDHVLFLYREKGRWGTVARSRDPGLHGRRPVFRTLRGLVDSYFDPFIDRRGRITGYAVGTLKELKRTDWRFSGRNVWRVERYFMELPHRKFNSSELRYAYWHRKYEAFKEKYPDKKPVYYPGRRDWAPYYPGRGSRAHAKAGRT